MYVTADFSGMIAHGEAKLVAYGDYVTYVVDDALGRFKKSVFLLLQSFLVVTYALFPPGS